jgi:hypothetical protein
MAYNIVVRYPKNKKSSDDECTLFRAWKSNWLVNATKLPNFSFKNSDKCNPSKNEYGTNQVKTLKQNLTLQKNSIDWKIRYLRMSIKT